MERNEPEWGGMDRNEPEWHRNGPELTGMAPEWTGMKTKWTGMDRNGPEWHRNDTGMNRNGPEWTGMNRNEPEWHRNGPEWHRNKFFCKKSLLLVNVLICVPELKVFKSTFSYACFIIICCWSGGLIRFATIFISQSPIPPSHPCRRITWYAKNNLFPYVRSTCRTFQWPTLKKGWRKLTTMMSQPKKTTGKLYKSQCNYYKS